MKLPALAVLIPYSKGVFVYVQTKSENLHHVLDTPNPRKILEAVRSLPPPRLVAWLGALPWTALSELLLEQTDLCLIPDPWLKHIPSHQLQRRADFTRQLLEVYFGDPICLLGIKKPGELISHS